MKMGFCFNNPIFMTYAQPVRQFRLSLDMDNIAPKHYVTNRLIK